MNLTPVTTDNISEVLQKIIDFTNLRQKLIKENIVSVNTPGYEPKDLDVQIFADLLSQAVCEHIYSSRLVLRDSDTIKFGHNGSFEAEPVVDNLAKSLIKKDNKQYLELQVKKLSENVLNNRIACDLLHQNQAVS